MGLASISALIGIECLPLQDNSIREWFLLHQNDVFYYIKNKENADYNGIFNCIKMQSRFVLKKKKTWKKKSSEKKFARPFLSRIFLR